MPHAHPKTDRLTLRPLRPGDAEPVARLVSDPEVWPWLTHVPSPYGEADAHAFIERFSAPAQRTFAMVHEGAFVGVAGLAGELGYWIGRPHWGRGLATEAAGALLADHFARSDEAVPSGHHEGNLRSARVLAKLGFRPTGAVDPVRTARGDIVRIHRMSLAADDWRGRA